MGSFRAYSNNRQQRSLNFQKDLFKVIVLLDCLVGSSIVEVVVVIVWGLRDNAASANDSLPTSLLTLKE